MKAQDLVRNILDSDDYPEEKRLLQMAYMAVSHHNYYSARDKYPSAEEISEILPDYNIWLESSGREQAIILAIFDVTDALLSDRPLGIFRYFWLMNNSFSSSTFICEYHKSPKRSSMPP